jgi:L-iditol 2-dehydrogenase
MIVGIMNQKGRIDLENRPIPILGPEDLLIKIEYVGICGSDIHLYQTGTCGGKDVAEPCVLGHEAAGSVAALGDEVEDFGIGDKVAIEPQIPCMKCGFCKQGKYNLCRSVRFYASPPTLEGCFAEYVAHPAGFSYKLPPTMDTLAGSMLEPFSVGLHATRQSGIRAGETAAVIGAGCIGLMTLLSLRAHGVKSVYVIDVLENRLKKAKEMGALEVMNSREMDVAQVLQDSIGGADYVFETAGRPQTIQQAGLMVKRGGTLDLVGYPPERQATFFVNHLINNEITVKTSFRYRNTYPIGINMVENGVNIQDVVSDIYDFEDVEQAMQRAIACKDEVTKCVIRMNAKGN